MRRAPRATGSETGGKVISYFSGSQGCNILKCSRVSIVRTTEQEREKVLPSSATQAAQTLQASLPSWGRRPDAHKGQSSHLCQIYTTWLSGPFLPKMPPSEKLLEVTCNIKRPCTSLQLSGNSTLVSNFLTSHYINKELRVQTVASQLLSQQQHTVNMALILE